LIKNTLAKKMSIEIWSDIMCPFCYIGKKRFETALQQSGHSENIEITWKSFQLNPFQKTEPGKSINQYLSEHKGISLHEAESMNQYVTKMALDEGLIFDFSKSVLANSFNAHKLSHLAKKYNVQHAIEEALFKAYFTDGKNIDDRNCLIQIGLEHGLNKEELEDCIDNETYSDAVRSDVEEAKNLRISGVPFFLFNRKYAISGAREIEVFKQALDVSMSEWQAMSETL
jgi:predicted DsbA family dithiol-disulfide isomerase